MRAGDNESPGYQGGGIMNIVPEKNAHDSTVHTLYFTAVGRGGGEL